MNNTPMNSKDNLNLNQVMNNKMTNQINVNTKCNSNTDFLTQVGHPDKHGYDVQGCRYDMKASPQNLTVNGPPLAWCNTYQTSLKDGRTTMWYPLNG